MAEAVFAGEFVEFDGGGYVLDGEALGLEEGDLDVGGAAGGLAGYYVAEFGDGFPAYCAALGARRRSPHSSWACSRESTVMRSDLRTVSLSSSLRTRELLPAALTWAPSAIHSPLTTGSRELVMVIITSAPVMASSGEGGGGNVDGELLGHGIAEGGEGVGAAAEDPCGLDIADGADGLKLGGGLSAGSDHADRVRGFLGQVFRCYAGGCTGSHTAEVVGLDDGEEVSGLGPKRRTMKRVPVR